MIMMKNILAKIKNNKKYKLIIIALIFAVPFFVISKYLTVVNNDVTINVRKPNYTVVFHSNNGEDDTVSQAFAYGTSQRLIANVFSYGGQFSKGLTLHCAYKSTTLASSSDKLFTSCSSL